MDEKRRCHRFSLQALTSIDGFVFAAACAPDSAFHCSQKSKNFTVDHRTAAGPQPRSARIRARRRMTLSIEQASSAQSAAEDNVRAATFTAFGA